MLVKKKKTTYRGMGRVWEETRNVEVPREYQQAGSWCHA